MFRISKKSMSMQTAVTPTMLKPNNTTIYILGTRAMTAFSPEIVF